MSVQALPEQDLPFSGVMPEPRFAEAQQWVFTDGTQGLMCHLGTMPGDMGLWHIAFAFTHADGRVFATKMVGRGPDGTFGSHTLHTRTIVPFKRWTINFDGAARAYAPEELWHGPGRDGQHVPMSFQIEVEAAHPVWVVGAHRADTEESLFRTTFRLHHEQALRARVTGIIGGEKITFDAIGHRDHSQGKRERHTVRHLWINGTFASGWAFAGMLGESDPGGSFDRSVVFEDGKIIPCSIEYRSDLSSTAAEPRKFEFALHRKDGKRHIIATRIRAGANWFGPGPTEWCLGTDLSEATHYHYLQYFSSYECEGEAGMGLVDRGARPAQLSSLCDKT